MRSLDCYLLSIAFLQSLDCGVIVFRGQRKLGNRRSSRLLYQTFQIRDLVHRRQVVVSINRALKRIPELLPILQSDVELLYFELQVGSLTLCYAQDSRVVRCRFETTLQYSLDPSACLGSAGWIQSSSSDLQKSLKFFPNLVSQLFIAVHEINYPSCFIVYYVLRIMK